MKKLISIIMAVVLISVMFVGCTSKDTAGDNAKGTNEEKTYTIKFAHEEAPGSFQDLYAKKFAEVMGQKSDGRVNVDIYTIGQLGSDQDIVQGLQTGTIDMVISSPGIAGTLIPEAQFFNLHFLFSENMDVNKYVLKNSKAINETLAGIYAEKGIKTLAFWTEGFMDWTSNKPLSTIEDFKGFKMRTMQSPLIISSYKAYAANPSPVPFSEVYSSLQLNMIDGQENPIYYIKHNNLDEVQDYLTFSRHAIYVAATTINPDFYDSLPKDIQQMILDTIEEIRDYSFEMQQDLNNKALEEMKKSSNIQASELTSEAREAFVEASVPVREEYIKQAGGRAKEIMDTLVKEIEEAKKKIK